MLEEYSERANYAKTKHLEMLKRFHIGDAVYILFSPFYHNWGIVVEVDTHCRKIYVDVNGVKRQYDPEWLIHTNPELRTNNQLPTAKTKQKRVASDVERISRLISRVANDELNKQLFQLDDQAKVIFFFKEVTSKFAGKNFQTSEMDRIERLKNFYREIKKLGVQLQVELVTNNADNKNYDVNSNFLITFKNNKDKQILIRGKAILSKLREVDGNEDTTYDFFVIYV